MEEEEDGEDAGTGGKRRAPLFVAKAMTQRVRDKHMQYDVSARMAGQEFVPFVLDSHGHMCPAALSLVERLARAAAEKQDRVGGAGRGMSAAVMTGHFVRRIAVALQRGVARLEQAAVTASTNSYRSRVARGVAAPARSASAADAVRALSSGSAADGGAGVRRGRAGGRRAGNGWTVPRRSVSRARK
jgi:hypothetical protein